MAETTQRSGFDPAPPVEPDSEEPLPFRAFTRRRLLLGILIAALIVLLAVVPPLFNVGRYKRRIASSLSASLGRPVHIDNVSLTLLPLPGFKLERFVVGEDPAFGAEPVLRADEVQATLRFGSLWRRRLEFSRIELTDPSINLVHLPDGRWNLENILLQASRMPAAPTAQPSAGGTPRFPYIEATGARINLKQGFEKTPFSLTEADVALWLPEPAQWHLRLKAHPARTDTAVSDTGVLRLDGTLGQAATLAAVPLDITANWTDTPLGALSLILTGRDAGMRGVMNLHATLQGAVGDSLMGSQLSLSSVRRADFVPEHSLSATVACSAHLLELFHVVDALHCTWPADANGSGLTADLHIPDALNPATAQGTVHLRAVPLAALLDALRIGSDRVSPQLTAAGLLSADLPCCNLAQAAPATSPARTAPVLTIPLATLVLADQPPFVHAPVSATSVRAMMPELSFSPIPLDLGGSRPAALAVQMDIEGLVLQLTGDVDPARLRALTQALPEIGDGLEQAISLPPGSTTAIPVNVIGEHRWTGRQTWTTVAATAAPQQRGRTRHHTHRP